MRIGLVHEKKMERKTSLAKIEANRENALKSTGPKSDKGKAVAKMNSMKYGLLAREVVIAEGSAKESRQEFTALLNTLRQDLSPVSFIEEMLVERIAVCHWRLRARANRRSGRDQLAARRGVRALVSRQSGSVLEDARRGFHNESDFLKTEFRLQLRRAPTQGLRGEVESCAELTEDTLSFIKRALGDNGETIGGLDILISMLRENPEKP